MSSSANLQSTSRQNHNNNVISENTLISAAPASVSGSNDEARYDEDRKKQLRRLRNKEAPARCRKRRVDQTMSLQTEVDRLEEVKRDLHQEMQSLQREMDKLKGILDLHQCSYQQNSKRSKTES